jgi:HMG-box domain
MDKKNCYNNIMNSPTTDFANRVCNEFAGQLRKHYSLDDSHIDEFSVILKDCVRTVGVPQSGGVAPAEKKKRRTRRLCGYNFYFKECMHAEEYKGLTHREKMRRIGAAWKLMGDEQRAPYTTMAQKDGELEETVEE